MINSSLTNAYHWALYSTNWFYCVSWGFTFLLVVSHVIGSWHLHLRYLVVAWSINYHSGYGFVRVGGIGAVFGVVSWWLIVGAISGFGVGFGIGGVIFGEGRCLMFCECWWVRVWGVRTGGGFMI